MRGQFNGTAGRPEFPSEQRHQPWRKPLRPHSVPPPRPLPKPGTRR
ncbi:hypothetical protein [Streptomyces smyrnaeus]